MSGDRLSATDALLACAAATSRAEMYTARMAMIRSGGEVLKDLDRTTLVAGDGTAGRHLLAGVGSAQVDSCAIRSSRLEVRLLGSLPRGGGAS